MKYKEYLKNDVIVIDIETVPDKELIEKSACKILKLKNFEEYKEYESQFVKKGKSWFPKVVFHKPICIGLLFISTHLNCKYIDFFNRENDKQILEEFWNLFYKCRCPTTIVSYAGKSFDMPVLQNRFLKYIPNVSELSIKGLELFMDTSDKWEKYVPNYKNPYSKYHIDLISEFGKPPASLIEACTLMDIPVKTTGHGSEIDEMTDDEIRIYCREDILATTQLWMKYDFVQTYSNMTEINENNIEIYNILLKKINSIKEEKIKVA